MPLIRSIKSHKRKVIFILSLFLCTTLLVSFRMRAKSSTRSEVEVVALKRRDLVQTLLIGGRMRSVSGEEIYSPAGGILHRYNVSEGDRVKRGSLLFEVRMDFDSSGELAKANSALKRAQSEFSQARSEHERALRIKKDISDKEYLAAKTLLEVKKANAEEAAQAKSRLEAAYGLSSDGLVRVYAAQDGTILRRHAEVGSYITSPRKEAKAESILTLSRSSETEMRARVLETDLRYLSVDQKAVVRLDAYPGELINGLVKRIGQVGVVDPKDDYVYFDVDISIDDKADLSRVNMNATAQVDVVVKKNVLALPRYAIASTGSDSFVQSELNGTVVFHKVKTGASSEEFIEISEGGLPPDLRLQRIDYTKFKPEELKGQLQ